MEPQNNEVTYSQGDASPPPPQQNAQPSYNQGNTNTSSNGDSGYKKPYNAQNNYKKPYDGKKRDVKPMELYLPYSLYIDENIPPEAAEQAGFIIKKLNDLSFTLRHQPSDTHQSITDLAANSTKTELYSPWDGFNDQKCNNNPTNSIKDYMVNFIASVADKPNHTKSRMSLPLSMLAGKFGNSPSLCVITWTPDGCVDSAESGRETGFLRPLIKIAGVYGIPVFNLAHPEVDMHVNMFLNRFKPLNKEEKQYG